MTVALTGEIDLAAVPDVASAVEGFITSSDHVLIDCSGVTFIDSSGLGALLELSTRLTTVVCGVPPPMEKLLHLTALDGHFTVFRDCTEAQMMVHAGKTRPTGNAQRIPGGLGITLPNTTSPPDATPMTAG